MEENEFYIQSVYWNKLQQLKFEIIYFNLHFNRCISIIKNIKLILAIFTTISLAVLMIFLEIKWVVYLCGGLGVLAQAISAFLEHSPYDSRKNELREMAGELDYVYSDMENDWFRIYNGEIYTDDITQKIKEYTDKQSSIMKNYFKNDALPEKKKIIITANEKVQSYFNNIIKGIKNEQ